MNKQILLIGGAGYIGTVLIRHLLDKKYHVTCLDNLIYNHSHSLSEFEKKLHSGNVEDYTKTV